MVAEFISGKQRADLMWFILKYHPIKNNGGPNLSALAFAKNVCVCSRCGLSKNQIEATSRNNALEVPEF